MLSSMQEAWGTEEEKKEITLHAPAGDATPKTAPVTTIAITLSRRKSGKQLEMP
jgi:hypothetical protein